MRVTVTLDDDVALAVKERARREKRTAGEVLSDLARQALTHQPAIEPTANPKGFYGFYGFEPFEQRGPAVSNAFIYRLRGQESV